jgi:hypothetical protein
VRTTEFRNLPGTTGDGGIRFPFAGSGFYKIGDQVADQLNVAYVEAARGDRPDPEAQAYPLGWFPRIERYRVFVGGDIGGIQHCLGLLPGDSLAA